MVQLLGEMSRLRVLFRADSGAAAMCIRNGISPRDFFRPFVREVARTVELRSINETHLRVTKMALKLCVVEEFEPVSPKVHSEMSELAQLVSRHCPGPDFDPDTAFTASAEHLTAHYSRRYWGDQQLGGKEDVPRVVQENQALQRSGNVPWYALYQQRYVSSLAVSEHEFLEHPLACLCVVNSADPDPYAKFREIFSASMLTPAWQNQHMHSDLPAFVILLHDPYAPGTPSEARLKELLGRFGPCSRVVTINSSFEGGQQVAVPWPDKFAAHSALVRNDKEPIYDSQPPASCFITGADCRSAEHAMDVFAFYFLLPLVERTIHTLNEHINALRRNSSTLRSWWSRFRSGKPEAAPGGSQQAVSTRPDTDGTLAALSDPSVHLTLSQGSGGDTGHQQPGHDLTKTSLNRWVKELGDLLFLVGDYENAQAQFKACMNDYKSDGEWRYYAGCLELSGLCSLAQSLVHRHRDSSVEPDLEKAISYYTRAAPEGSLVSYATRAGFFLSYLLRQKSRYRDAADVFSRLASLVRDLDPLRCAILLEQASLCYLQEPSLSCFFRKCTFQLVVAGKCYEAAGQRSHALGCYATSFLVYQNRGWYHIEDHVRTLMVRLLLALGYIRAATEHIRVLLRPSTRQSPQTQCDNLRETLHWMENLSQRGGHETPLPVAPVPFTPPHTVSLYTTARPRSLQRRARTASLPSLASVKELKPVQLESWQNMEAMLTDELSFEAQQGKRLINKYSYQYIFGPFDGPQNPIGASVVSEAIQVDFGLRNPLMVPLQLEAVQLLISHYPLASEPVNPNDPLSDFDMDEGGDPFLIADASSVLCRTTTVLIGARELKQISLTAIPLREGLLKIRGAAFLLSGKLWARVEFKMPPIRLNRTKQHRENPSYEASNSLTLRIAPPMPLLHAEWKDFPQYLLSGEIRRCSILLKNTGKAPLTNFKLKVSHPEVFLFGPPSHLERPFPPEVPLTGGDASSVLLDCVPRGAYSPGSLKRGIIYLDEFIGVLQPEASVTLPVWAMGASTGTCSYQFLFYYEPITPNPAMPFRFLRLEHEIRVHQGLQIAASVKPASAALGEYVISVELVNKQQTAIFQLDQLVCLSHNFNLVPLSRENDPLFSEEIRVVHPRHSSLIYLRAIPKTDGTSHNSIHLHETATPLFSGPFLPFFDRFHSLVIGASSAPAKSGDRDGLQSPQLPPSRSHIAREQAMSDDSPHELGLIFFWRTANKLHFGQYNLKRVKLLATPQSAPLSLGQIIQSAPAGSLNHLLQFRLEFPAQVAHDFAQAPFCTVPVRFHLHNSSSVQPLSFFFETLRPSESKEVPFASLHETKCQYFFVGHTKQFVSQLPPQGHMSLDTFVTFLSAGVFNLNRFRFAVPQSDNHLRAAHYTYSPLQYLIAIVPPTNLINK